MAALRQKGGDTWCRTGSSRELNPALPPPSFHSLQDFPFWQNSCQFGEAAHSLSIWCTKFKENPRKGAPKTWDWPATGAIISSVLLLPLLHLQQEPVNDPSSTSHLPVTRTDFNTEHYNTWSLCHQGCWPQKLRLTQRRCCCQTESVHPLAWHDPSLQKIFGLIFLAVSKQVACQEAKQGPALCLINISQSGFPKLLGKLSNSHRRRFLYITLFCGELHIRALCHEMELRAGAAEHPPAPPRSVKNKNCHSSGKCHKALSHCLF